MESAVKEKGDISHPAPDRFQILVENIRDQAVLLLDQLGHVLSWNIGLQNLNGYTANEVVGMHFSTFYTPEDNASGKPAENLKQATERGGFTEQSWRVRKDGSRYLAHVSITPLMDAGTLLGYAKVFRNAHEGSSRSAPSQRESMADAILITDSQANIIRANQSFQSLFGFSAEELQGKRASMLASGRNDKAFYASMWASLIEQGNWVGEMLDKRKDGSVFKAFVNISAIKNDYGDTIEYVAVFKDMSERSAEFEQGQRLAYFDALTNLPNRRLLLDRLQMSIATTARNEVFSALLFLDIDHFKVLNDTLGHDCGDQLLIQFATRIRSCVREVDTVSRLGGDEFVVLFEQVDAREQNAWKKVGLVAEKIRAILSEPFMLKTREYQTSPSIGVTLFRGDHCTIETLLKQADIAMYHAKQSGRNTVRFFDPHMQKSVEARALLESELAQAVPDRQLRLHYQVQVDNEMKPVGAEALVRWAHPTGGVISPAKFIPIAEESSLIILVGQWVLESACEQLAKWQKSPATQHLILSVNLSAQQFRMPDFVASIASIINAHKIDPSRLRLEFSESVVLNDVPELIAKLTALKALGVKLALEDFGTGYSSLTYLRQLPIDQLKIDGSFVHEITSPEQDTVMVETIINMARRFGLELIAESVETDEQVNFLRQHGCHAYQGYLLGKPVPIEEFDAQFNTKS